MKFVSIQKTDKVKYEKLVNNSKKSTCMQMWEWADFRNYGISKLYERVGVIDDLGNMRLAASYSINRFKSLANVLYIPQGPIWDKDEALKVFTDNIRQIASCEKCIAIIIEPRIKLNSKRFHRLKSLGFVFTNKAVQPRETIMLDLSMSEESLLASFSKNTRYNIRYAKKKGIKVEMFDKESDVRRVDMFYDLLKETQKRKYFHVQDKNYFRSLYLQFSKNKHIRIYEASYKSEVIGSMIVVYHNKWAASLFSASSIKYTKFKPIYLLRWRTIKDMKSLGCNIYDFFGATSSQDRTHPFYFTTQHKLGYSKEITRFAGTFEIILNPLKYKAWRIGEKAGLYKFYEEAYLKEFKKRNSN